MAISISFAAWISLAAKAGYKLTAVPAVYVLSCWSCGKHCPDIATVDLQLQRMEMK